MSTWKEYKLEDIIDKFIDYRGKTPQKTSSGIPLVTAKIVKNGKIDIPDEFIAVEDYQSWMRRGYPEINDVVMTTEAPLGEVALLKNKNVALAQRIITLRGKKDICYNAFLKYYLQSPSGQEELQGRASGTTVEGIKAAELRKIQVLLPSLPEQRAIAGVLSSLDDKIDLLHRQNKTLEAMAGTLWRKIFIEDAEKGWKKGKLGDVAINIKNNVNMNILQGNEHYIGLEHIERKHLALYNWGQSSDVESNKSRFNRGDILFGKLRAYFHKVCFTPFEGICSTDILVIRPKQPEYFHFCLMWFFSEDVVNYSDASSGGTRMPRTNWETLAGFDIDIPDKAQLAEFNGIVKPLIERIEHNIHSFRTLSRLRDTLLPKLLSGEVKVKV